MSDLIYRQVAIEAVNRLSLGETDAVRLSLKITDYLKRMPSVHSDLITWLLDEIWDEDVWELNWQAFPELLCRKLEKLGYVKRKGDEYERLD